MSFIKSKIQSIFSGSSKPKNLSNSKENSSSSKKRNDQNNSLLEDSKSPESHISRMNKTKNSRNRLYQNMKNAILKANIQIDPEIISYIHNTDRREILYGKVELSKRRASVVEQLEQFANEKERNLFIFINTVLQYPPCVETIHCSYNTDRCYEYAIRRYVTYMASKDFTKDDFIVDGFLMKNCMVEALESDKQIKSDSQGTFKTFIYAQKKLYICLQIYNAKELSLADPEVIMRNSIPNLSYITNYRDDRQERLSEFARKEFHNKGKCIDEDYTLEQASQMMNNMYNSTGESGKHLTGSRTNVFQSINAILEFLLGHHLVLRSENKRNAEISDLSYVIKDTGRGLIPMLILRVAKNNTSALGNKPEYVATCRNKKVELCMVGALAMSLWFRFDFKDGPLYGIQRPDFLKKSTWYKRKILFSQRGKDDKPISVSYENSLVLKFCQSIGFQSVKKTLLGRKNTARFAEAHNIEEAEIGKNGISSLKFQFIHFMAGFNADEPYIISRDIEPPTELKKKVFPWLDGVIKLFRNRNAEEGLQNIEKDDSAPQFLNMLLDFRSIILQDLAVLSNKAPNSIFSKHILTKDPLFIKFKEEVEICQREPIGFGKKYRNVIDQVSPEFSAKIRVLENLCEANRQQTRYIQKSIESLCEQTKEDYRKVEMKIENLQNIIEKLETKISEMFAIHFHNFSSLLDAKLKEYELRIRNINGSNTANDEYRFPESGSNSPFQNPVSSELFANPEYPINGKYLQEEALPPSMPMLRSISTVPELVEEWYQPNGEIPSIKNRDVLYKSSWRGNDCHLHKRRKVVISFIESQLKDTKTYGGLGEADVGNLLEEYRKEKKIELNGLSEHLKPQNRAKVSNELKKRLRVKYGQ